MPDEQEEAIFGNATCVFSNSVGAFTDTTLQTLDRRVGDKKMVLGRDMFAQSVGDWDGIPIIYQRKGVHPDDFEGVTRNPAEAAQKIGGSFVGNVKNPRIEVGGHPRLKGTLDITDMYSEICELYDKGVLGISSAFVSRNNGDQITSPPKPNHVLLFEEVIDKVQPGDPGALVHTTEIMTEEKPTKKVKKPFVEWLRSLVKSEIAESQNPPSVTPVVNPPAETNAPVTNAETTMPENITPPANPEQAEASPELRALAEAIAQRDAKIAELEQTIADLKAQGAEMNTIRAELAQYKEKEAEHKFTVFLESVPVGMKSTPEQVAELKQTFTTDPASLLTKVINTYREGGETRKVGDPFTHTAAQPDTCVGDLTKPQRN